MTKINAVWIKLSLFKRTVIVTAMALCLTLFANALNKPRYVNLITADIDQITSIRGFLDANGIMHRVNSETQIQVDEKIRAQTILKLASANVITPEMNSLIERQKTMDDLATQSFLQAKIEEMIVDSCDVIERAHVVLQLNPFHPSACVKLVLKEDISTKSINGIQTLVAVSVDQLIPDQVVIVNNDNKLLNEVINETKN